MLSRRLGTAVLVYGLLGASGAAWSILAGRSPLWLPNDEAWLGAWLPDAVGRMVLSLLLGVAVAVVVIRGTPVLVERTLWARRMHMELRSLLGPMSGATIAFFALTSGAVEELFFRGAMQPAFGLVITSIVFGAAHLGHASALLPLALWAAIMGAVFGVLYALTGSLIGPVAAHVLINYENMHYLVSYDPVTVSREKRIAPDAPTLVGSRVRSSAKSPTDGTS